MELRQLRRLAAVARHGSFSAAATAVGLTQPALSRSVAALESSLGVRLFDRGRLGAELTAPGRVVLERATRVLDEADELERELALLQKGESGEVVLSVGSYAVATSVGQACAQLLARRPGLRLRMSTTSDLEGAVEDVLQRQIDLAVIDMVAFSDRPGLALEPLPRHRGGLVCRAGHPLAGASGLTLDQVLRFPFAGPRLPRRASEALGPDLGAAGTIDARSGDFVPTLMVETVGLAKQIVATSDAMTLTVLWSCASELEEGLLVELELPALASLTTSYGFVHRAGRTLSPAAEALMAEVRGIESEISDTERARWNWTP